MSKTHVRPTDKKDLIILVVMMVLGLVLAAFSWVNEHGVQPVALFFPLGSGILLVTFILLMWEQWRYSHTFYDASDLPDGDYICSSPRKTTVWHTTETSWDMKIKRADTNWKPTWRTYRLITWHIMPHYFSVRDGEAVERKVDRGDVVSI